MKNAKRPSVPAREAVPDWVEEHFRRNREWLLASALKLCRNRAQAEELTQEVFARLVRSSPGMKPFPSDLACKSWLLIALRRALVDRYRKEQAHEQLGTAPLAESPEAMEFPDDLKLDRQLVQELIKQASLELPPALRETFDLYARGLSYPEMAQRLGIKQNALRKRLHGVRHRIMKSVLTKLQARGVSSEEMAELLSMRESRVREILDAAPSPEEEE